MPISYFPEGDTVAVGDDELRSLHKQCSRLYDLYGDRGPAYYPEGSQPLVGDDEDRLQQKIAALLG